MIQYVIVTHDKSSGSIEKAEFLQLPDAIGKMDSLFGNSCTSHVFNTEGMTKHLPSIMMERHSSEADSFLFRFAANSMKVDLLFKKTENTLLFSGIKKTGKSTEVNNGIFCKNDFVKVRLGRRF